MEKERIRYAVVIQCEHTMKRCSGFACSESFFGKTAAFEGYGDGTKYLTMTCGGCNGTCVAARLEHFEMKLRKLTDIKKKRSQCIWQAASSRITGITTGVRMWTT